MSDNLSENIKSLCPYLFDEFGFQVTNKFYDAQRFGDSIVTLESKDLRARFKRDRGVIMLEIGSLSKPDEWWDSEFISELFGLLLVSPDVERPEVEWINAFGLWVKEHHVTLVKRFSPAEVEKTYQQLEDFTEARYQKWLKGE